MIVHTALTRRTIISLLLAALPLSVRAQGSLLEQGKSLLGGAAGGSHAGAGLSEGEIGGGLKDALKVASQRVVGRVGKSDGYFGDPAIRIPLPGPLQKIAGPLKSV